MIEKIDKGKDKEHRVNNHVCLRQRHSTTVSPIGEYPLNHRMSILRSGPSGRSHSSLNPSDFQK